MREREVRLLLNFLLSEPGSTCTSFRRSGLSDGVKRRRILFQTKRILDKNMAEKKINTNENEVS
jgi:hypothetical protein